MTGATVFEARFVIDAPEAEPAPSGASPGAAASEPPRRGKGSRQPSEGDIEVGRRIRRLRVAGGLTLKDLARRVDITYVQLHRYETGASRVPAGRLLDIAGVLGVRAEALIEAPAETGDAHRLMEAFRHITDQGRRAALIGVALSLADREGPEPSGQPCSEEQR